MQKKLFILLTIFIFSCEEDNPVGPIDTTPSKLYVCDQGSDRVLVLDATTDNLNEISTVNINFSESTSDMEVPHFVAIDEQNGYWFVTTFQAGYVGMYDLETDTFIGSVYLGDSPALLTIHEDEKMLYVSKMMSMGMTSGSQNDELGVIDYSSGLPVASDPIALTDSYQIISFPEPHAISLDTQTARGVSLITASFTSDWFSHINLSGSIPVFTALPFNEGDVAPVEVNELFPLDATQKDDHIFFSCRGSIDASVNGQVQSWNLVTYDQEDIYEFDTTSKPWHIIASPVESKIFVVLSGDDESPGSAGLACLSYSETGSLSLEWKTTDSSFDTLHGATISSDGTRIYISSRGSGSIHVFDDSGNLLNTIENIGMDMGMGALSGIAVTQVE